VLFSRASALCRVILGVHTVATGAYPSIIQNATAEVSVVLGTPDKEHVAGDMPNRRTELLFVLEYRRGEVKEQFEVEPDTVWSTAL